MSESKNTVPSEPQLSHLNQQGEANMVDVTEKAMTSRTATAQGVITMNRATFELVKYRLISPLMMTIPKCWSPACAV